MHSFPMSIVLPRIIKNIEGEEWGEIELGVAAEPSVNICYRKLSNKWYFPFVKQP